VVSVANSSSCWEAAEGGESSPNSDGGVEGGSTLLLELSVATAVAVVGYPGVVLFNSARVLLNSTRVPMRVCGPYRSKNAALEVFRTPGGVLGTCFAL
jgi:hypothetical protein